MARKRVWKMVGIGVLPVKTQWRESGSRELLVFVRVIVRRAIESRLGKKTNSSRGAVKEAEFTVFCFCFLILLEYS